MCVHVEMLSIMDKALLVKLHYKDTKNSIARLSCMHGKRYGKGPISYFALTKMLQKFEATVSFCPRNGIVQEISICYC